MCGTFRIQSHVLEEDLCRPLHLPWVSCPRRQGVRCVGGSRAREEVHADGGITVYIARKILDAKDATYNMP